MLSAMLAEEASTISGALTTAMGTIATDATSAVAAILPVALPVLGIGVVVGLGIKIFKKVTSK